MDRRNIRKQASQHAHSEASHEVHQWSLLLKCTTAVLLVSGVLYLIYIMISKGSAKTDGQLAPSVQVSMNVMEKGAEAVARAFLESDSVEGKAAYVFDSERVLPLMRDYYQRHPDEEEVLQGLTNHKYHVAGGREFLLSTAVFEDNTRASWVFEKDPVSGHMLIQWEVLVHYSEVDWDTFLDERQTEPRVFRITLEILGDPYFNFAFTDPERYLCLRARFPDSERAVYAYLDKSSTSYRSFAPVRRMSDLAAMPVIAALKFPPNAKTDEQVEIDEIISHSWVEGVEM